MHKILGTSTYPPFPESSEMVQFGMGCFWGAERMFWQQPGVISTQVGYAGGSVPSPTYKKVCSGSTGHAEVVRVVYDPTIIRFQELLKLFWENHDPTQGNYKRTLTGQYRSAIFVYSDEQLALAERSQIIFQEALGRRGLGEIHTEIRKAPEFYYAEDYHQQYFFNDSRNCGHGSNGVIFDLSGL